MTKPDFVIGAVFEALRAQPRKSNGVGRAIMFIAARRGEGVTSAARQAALGMGQSAVCAIDLDLRRNGLARALAQTGALGPKLDGAMGGVHFCAANDGTGQALPQCDGAYSYRRVGGSEVYVGVYDGRCLPKGARVLISAAPDYWDAARENGAFVVVDAPALQWSKAGLRVARHMDAVVLVVSSEPGAAPAALSAKAELLAAGAHLMGLIYSKASMPAAAMDRLLRQAS